MISIDTVYQRVLALANKEQRGYITPLEYNLHANQAQQLIFEQYFYDLDVVKKSPTDTSSTSDMEELIENKLAPFTTIQAVTGGTNYPQNYRTGRIFVSVGVTNHEAKLVSVNESRNYLYSRFHNRGLFKNPIYIKSNISGNDIEVLDDNGVRTSGVTCEVINRPNKVEWGYDVINEKALYNASRSTNYQLHESEETELVYKILTLAGITINKSGLSSVALALDNTNTSQQKQ